MDTGTPSEAATHEKPTEADEADAPPQIASFPPYPPYIVEPVPPSLADTIVAGHDLRLKHKSVIPKPIHPPPMPAKPRGPKATDVHLSKRAMRAHARCLHRHGAILTDRLERLSKPMRRKIIYMWREKYDTLPPETIDRFRSMLNADEPFKPDQAYKYFINLKNSSKKKKELAEVNEIKKDMLEMVDEKRFIWAKNATVAFAKGIQQRLSKPGKFALSEGMARLSDIILDEICGYMHMRTPSRQTTNPKAKCVLEMSDKIAVWIDEILSESEDRMLMMDFDEDAEVERFFEDESKPEEDGTVTPIVDVVPPTTTPVSHGSPVLPASPQVTPGSGATPGTPGSPNATPQTDVTPQATTAVSTPLVTPGESVTPVETSQKPSGTDVKKD